MNFKSPLDYLELHFKFPGLFDRVGLGNGLFGERPDPSVCDEVNEIKKLVDTDGNVEVKITNTPYILLNNMYNEVDIVETISVEFPNGVALPGTRQKRFYTESRIID